MAKRVSKIASSLKQLGEIQVSEWDFMGLLNTEIRELEISRSLKRWGSIQVMDWDFSSVMPAIRETANREVDLASFFKRAAHIKVLERDFKSAAAPPQKPPTSPPDIDELAGRLGNFLQCLVVNLIDEPKHAHLTVIRMGPAGLRFKVVMVKRDVAMLVGREGHTAAAIRNILQGIAGSHGVQALLQIHSHEEELEFQAKAENAKR